MVIIVVLDDNNGMMFNNRRQSQDRLLRENIINECNGAKLWINKYTEKQFEQPLLENIMVDEAFLDKAENEDYCFVENLSLTGYEDKIDKIVIFRWNRVYPADKWFDLPMENYLMVSREEFAGSSHKVIAKEVWVNE